MLSRYDMLILELEGGGTGENTRRTEDINYRSTTGLFRVCGTRFLKQARWDYRIATRLFQQDLYNRDTTILLQ